MERYWHYFGIKCLSSSSSWLQKHYLGTTDIDKQAYSNFANYFTFFKTFLRLSYYSFHALTFLLILVPFYAVMALTMKNNELSSGTWQHVFRHYLPFQSNILKISLSSVTYHLDHIESEFQNTFSNTYAKITYASTYTNTYSLILQTLALS